MMKKLFVFTDGGALDNPGPAAVGVVIRRENGKVLTSFGKFIGNTTNNVAEYQGVIEALNWLKNNFQFSISPKANQAPLIFNFQFFLDSRLVVNQLNGLFKIKNPKLRELIFKVRQLEQELGGSISYQHIPREKNFLADAEVKKILAKKSRRKA